MAERPRAPWACLRGAGRLEALGLFLHWRAARAALGLRLEEGHGLVGDDDARVRLVRGWRRRHGGGGGGDGGVQEGGGAQVVNQVHGEGAGGKGRGGGGGGTSAKTIIVSSLFRSCVATSISFAMCAARAASVLPSITLMP